MNFRGPLIEAMLAEGHEVLALAPQADDGTRAWLARHGVAFHPIPLSRAGLSPLGDFATYSAIRSVLRHVRPDIVVGYTIKAVIYGMLAAKAAAVPVRCAMITGLGYAFTDGDASLKRRMVGRVARGLYALALRQAQVAIFQNPDDLALFRKLSLLAEGTRVGIVNGSGVDTRHFALSPLPSEPVCLMISRLVADKGVVEFLMAAKQVKAKRPDVRFVLIGPTDPNPAALPTGLLETSIAEGVVDYRGEVFDVRPAIAACSIYVLPSYREGTPRSVLEAMSMGRPVVTTDAPGCRETVTDNLNGLLVPVRSADDLAAAIIRLSDDGALRARFGEAGREMAVARYDASKVARSVLELLRLAPEPSLSVIEHEGQSGYR